MFQPIVAILPLCPKARLPTLGDQLAGDVEFVRICLAELFMVVTAYAQCSQRVPTLAAVVVAHLQPKYCQLC